MTAYVFGVGDPPPDALGRIPSLVLRLVPSLQRRGAWAVAVPDGEAARVAREARAYGWETEAGLARAFKEAGARAE